MSRFSPPCDEQTLRNLYEVQGKTRDEIASILGCTAKPIQTALRRFGIQTRPAYRRDRSGQPKRVCLNCQRFKANKRSLCQTCYRDPIVREMYPKADRRLDRAAQFWQQVNKTDGCWEWTGRLNSNGYGVLTASGAIYAHRFSYQIHVRPVEKDECVLHRCDNPRCVRPDHLFIGTRTDNSADKVNKGRQPKGNDCPNAKLTPKLVRVARELVANGQKLTALARSFGVSHASLSRAVSGKTWRHVDA